MAAGATTETSMRRDAVAIGVAAGAYAVSYGVLAVSAGLSVAQTCAMSVLVFTGATQFAVVGVLGAGGSIGAALGPGLLLAARNAVYGVALARILRGGRAARAVKAQFVIDETTAMARAREDPREAERAFLATGFSVFVCWNVGSLAGALIGSGIGDVRDYGLDAMFPAAFLALLSPQLRRPGAPVTAVAGALVAVALVPFVPAGVPILAALAGLIPGMLSLRRAPQDAS